MIFRFVALMNMIGSLLVGALVVVSITLLWLLLAIPKIVLVLLSVVLVMCFGVAMLILYASTMIFIEGKTKW